MREDWQPIPWEIGTERRMDYRRSVAGPHGCVLWLIAEEWQTVAGKWAARAEIGRGVGLCLPLRAAGCEGDGYPTPEAAIEVCEAWLAEWRAGWAAAGDVALLAEIPTGGALDVRDAS